MLFDILMSFLGKSLGSGDIGPGEPPEGATCNVVKNSERTESDGFLFLWLARTSQNLCAKYEKSRLIAQNPARIADNRICESWQILKESCLIVFNRGKNKESFFLSSFRLERSFMRCRNLDLPRAAAFHTLRGVDE
jgi:hypothetical protein